MKTNDCGHLVQHQVEIAVWSGHLGQHKIDGTGHIMQHHVTDPSGIAVEIALGTGHVSGHMTLGLVCQLVIHRPFWVSCVFYRIVSNYSTC